MAAIGGKRAGNAVVAPVQLRGVADLSHPRWGLHDGGDLAPVWQAAHDWLRDTYGGGVVLTPPGNYGLSRDVYLDAGGIEIVGAGRNLTSIGTGAWSSLIVSLPRFPAGRVLSNGHRPDLHDILDASACPAAGIKWGLRTWDPATATFAHPVFFGGPLNGGKAVGIGPNFDPDFWKTLDQLTIEWVLHTPDGTLVDGPVFGAVSTVTQPVSSVPGNAAVCVSEPLHLYYEATAARYRLVFTTVALSGEVRNRIAYLPVASVPAGLHRVSVTIDLRGAAVLAWVDRTQVTPNLSLINGMSAPNDDWLPNRGLHFFEGAYAPFNLGTIDGTAFQESLPGNTVGGDLNLDRTFCGLRLTEGYVYENRGVGLAQQRLDAATLDDLHQFFWGDPGTLCFLALTDPPGPDRAVKLATGPSGGDGASPTRGLFLSAEHANLLTGMATANNAVRHLTIRGGGPWGMPITKGAPWDCTIDDVTATGGWTGVGGSLFGVSFTYTVKGNCQFEGKDSGWFGYVETIHFEDATYFSYPGRTAARLIGASGWMKGAFLGEPKPYTDYGTIFHGWANGGNFALSGLDFDAEGGPNPTYSIICMEAHQSSGWSGTLVVRDSLFGSLGPNASVITLRSTAPSSALPAKCIIDNVVVTGGGNRAMVLLDDPGKRFSSSLKNMRHIHDDVPWIEYAAGTTPGGTTVELDGDFSIPPRRGAWAPNSFTLAVPNPLPGQYRAWIGPYRGEACGSADPPEWTGIDPVGDGRTLAGYCLGRSYALHDPDLTLIPHAEAPNLAASFNGSNQYLQVNSNSALRWAGGDLTVAGWIKLNPGTAMTELFGKGWAAVPEYEVTAVVGSYFEVLFWKAAGGAVDLRLNSIVPATGVWYFVMIEYLNATTTGKITVNLSHSASVVIPGGLDPGGVDPFWIGKDSQGFGYLPGKADRFALWQRALTDAEKSYVYNSGNGRSYAEIGRPGDAGADLKTGLAPWWDMDEESDGSADVTRLDSHGTNHLTSFGHVPSAPGVPD